MPLLSQIQAIVGSILFGFFFSFFWMALYRFTLHLKWKFLRIFIELPLFLGVVFFYHSFLLIIVDGVFNLFYIPALIFGGWIFNKFYKELYMKTLDRLCWKMTVKFLQPIQLKIARISSILKKKQDEKKKKRSKKHGRKQSQSQSDI